MEYSDVCGKVEEMFVNWKEEPSKERPLENEVKLVVKYNLKDILKETVEQLIAGTEKFK